MYMLQFFFQYLKNSDDKNHQTSFFNIVLFAKIALYAQTHNYKLIAHYILEVEFIPDQSQHSLWGHSWRRCHYNHRLSQQHQLPKHLHVNQDRLETSDYWRSIRAAISDVCKINRWLRNYRTVQYSLKEIQLVNWWENCGSREQILQSWNHVNHM